MRREDAICSLRSPRRRVCSASEVGVALDYVTSRSALALMRLAATVLRRGTRHLALTLGRARRSNRSSFWSCRSAPRDAHFIHLEPTPSFVVDLLGDLLHSHHPSRLSRTRSRKVAPAEATRPNADAITGLSRDRDCARRAPPGRTHRSTIRYARKASTLRTRSGRRPVPPARGIQVEERLVEGVDGLHHGIFQSARASEMMLTVLPNFEHYGLLVRAHETARIGGGRDAQQSRHGGGEGPHISAPLLAFCI